jgi:3-phosphoshikimate 1-carboxyvinyltransferase
MTEPPAEPHPITVRPAGPLVGRIRVPGDKSISHRALMFASLAVGQTRIDGLLEGEDVLRTAAAMRALGAAITRDGGTWRVAGRGIGGLVEPDDVLDMGNSGTAARLLTGLLATHPIFTVMTGDASLRRRPMRRVTDPLAATGARFTAREGGRLPLAIEGTGEALSIEHRLLVASAQVKSALLLAGLNARGDSVVDEPVPTRDHTENMLRHFGARLTVEPLEGGGNRLTLAGQPELVARDVEIPGDPSSAAFPLVAALLVPGSSVTVARAGLAPLRTGLLQSLREMGADLTLADRREQGGEPIGDITATASALRAVDVPADRAPSMIDEYPILAVACACAHGTSRLRGLGELRVKESDRLTATAALLTANGVRVTIEGDDLLIEGSGGPPPGGGHALTLMDHRLAMSAIVLGLAARAPVSIDDTRFIDTSFPGFVALMNSLGAHLPEPGPA